MSNKNVPLLRVFITLNIYLLLFFFTKYFRRQSKIFSPKLVYLSIYFIIFFTCFEAKLSKNMLMILTSYCTDNHAKLSE